jgi:hypothetical protein
MVRSLSYPEGQSYATFPEQYLQSPLQLEHACNLIVESELFAFHSERMCEIMADEARSVRDYPLIFFLFLIRPTEYGPTFPADFLPRLALSWSAALRFLPLP